MVVEVVAALAVAVLLDAPTSVFLVVALVIAFSFLTMCSSRGRRRRARAGRPPADEAIHNFVSHGPLADPAG